MAIYSQMSINGSVEWLSIPTPFCDTGVTWTDNLLVLKALWGDSVRVEAWAWGTQPGVLIGYDVRGVASSLPMQLTFPGVSRKMRVQLCADSVTITFGRTVWRGLKMSCTPTTLAVKSGLIGPMRTGMIFGTNRLINNFCIKFPLVVSVATF